MIRHDSRFLVSADLWPFLRYYYLFMLILRILLLFFSIFLIFIPLLAFSCSFATFFFFLFSVLHHPLFLFHYFLLFLSFLFPHFQSSLHSVSPIHFIIVNCRLHMLSVSHFPLYEIFHTIQILYLLFVIFSSFPSISSFLRTSSFVVSLPRNDTWCIYLDNGFIKLYFSLLLYFLFFIMWPFLFTL